MVNIKIVSKRDGGVKPSEHDVIVNIDRDSPLGNPFRMVRESDRDHVIGLYREWLMHQHRNNKPVIAELGRIIALAECGHSIALSCWCAPKRCHGEVIKECVEAMILQR